MPMRKTFTASQKASIVLEALKEAKTVAQIASENGIHPNQIYKWKKQALENFQQLFEDDRQGEKAQAALREKQVNELYSEIGKLSTPLKWLKKNLVSTFSRERLKMLERERQDVSLKAQAELLGVTSFSFRSHPKTNRYSRAPARRVSKYPQNIELMF